ncbi:MAG: hypothetical protein KY475_02295 [Planctomycetes bacterium]|nr:hypothetical protein [Planctomycetota bacterium]
MRQLFFLGILFFIVGSLVAAGIFLFGRALYTLYDDWRESRELDELQAEIAARRQQRKAAGEEERGELS